MVWLFESSKGIELPTHDPADLTPAVMLDLLRQAALHYFPQLAPDTAKVAT